MCFRNEMRSSGEALPTWRRKSFDAARRKAALAGSGCSRDAPLAIPSASRPASPS
ncbi:hypothetical protein PQB35_gp05 [Ochrobactrum phage vB_OspP_OH]|uniref:Uncharacterized protein n=1 Tax=Ochrobactrum phage vB_OspP_OH TaxID=2712957 RepID=A0A6G6XXN1_9CAUD|nr:hypothetical protein PQB35_gp05 [Ochrobactrum phage vB_OspP_OH]QIG66061.1 hypothetical protein phiOH_p05 [Ochrobactrum phage vB_OspP_OH]